MAARWMRSSLFTAPAAGAVLLTARRRLRSDPPLVVDALAELRDQPTGSTAAERIASRCDVIARRTASTSRSTSASVMAWCCKRRGSDERRRTPDGDGSKSDSRPRWYWRTCAGRARADPGPGHRRRQGPRHPRRHPPADRSGRHDRRPVIADPPGRRPRHPDAAPARTRHRRLPTPLASAEGGQHRPRPPPRTQRKILRKIRSSPPRSQADQRRSDAHAEFSALNDRSMRCRGLRRGPPGIHGGGWNSGNPSLMTTSHSPLWITT
jgi:hypothetical protein